MIVLSLHAAIVVIILLAMMQAGCTARSASTGHASASTSSDRLHIERIYDSPTGPDLYRIKGPHGTSYHQQLYKSPIRKHRKDVAPHNTRP